jgi:drug/metabolite transporter (DMT)-like permease
VGVLVGWSPTGLDTPALLSSGAVLLAALLYAAGNLYAKHRMGEAPVLTLALGQQLGAVVWLVPPALVTASGISIRAGALGALAALAILSTAVAYLLFFWLIGRVGPVKTSTVTYAIPVFGVLWGALLLDEPVTPGIVAGLGCILLSLTLVNHGRASALRPSSMTTP